MLRPVSVLAFGLLVAGACRRADAPRAAVTATAAEFGQLGWLAGKWRGSGGQYPAFFEQYEAVNDSTFRMRTFADSMFRTVADSSSIELRGGTIRNGPTVVVELASGRVRFLPEGAASGGYAFERVSADEWTATLYPSAPGGPTTVYVMRRASP